MYYLTKNLQQKNSFGVLQSSVSYCPVQNLAPLVSKHLLNWEKLFDLVIRREDIAQQSQLVMLHWKNNFVSSVAVWDILEQAPKK